MDAVNQRLTQFVDQLQRFTDSTWYVLRSPKTTGILLVISVIVLLLGLIIPQQSEPVFSGTTARTVWIATLPLWLQARGNLLYALGLANIFQTLWFWLPVALLLLNSLIALADYTPGSWRRVGRSVPPINWQHPLAQRVEYSVRLPSLPDDFLETLRERLPAKRFALYQSTEAEQRVIGAAQRRWAWLGPVACYVGLIGLSGAFLITYYALKSDRFTLLPFQPQSSFLFKGEFELTKAESSGLSRVAYTLPGAEASPQMLTWRRYQPSFWGNTLILPVAIEPMLTIEVRDATNTLLGLAPLQKNIPPVEHLNLSLDESNSPLYFSIPAHDIAVQVSPDPARDEPIYNVQVRRGTEAVLLENARIQPGQEFQVDGFSAVMFLNHKVTVIARRDPALPLYFLSTLLILIGLVLTFLRPPILVWLMPEVKGMGGQLYGVMEKFGSREKMVQFLEELLAVEASSEQ